MPAIAWAIVIAALLGSDVAYVFHYGATNYPEGKNLGIMIFIGMVFLVCSTIVEWTIK